MEPTRGDRHIDRLTLPHDDRYSLDGVRDHHTVGRDCRGECPKIVSSEHGHRDRRRTQFRWSHCITRRDAQSTRARRCDEAEYGKDHQHSMAHLDAPVDRSAYREEP